jgi:hypothetical protein
LSLAISLIKATVSGEIFGLGDAALDLYFQYSLNPWRCHRKRVVFLNDEQRLFPCSNYSCKKHEDHAIRFVTNGPFGMSAQDNQLLAKERVFCHQFGLASGKICRRPHHERGGGVRFGPVYEVVLKRLKAKACQPFDE